MACDADEVVPAQMDLTNAVLLGREDFTIRSIDAVLGQEKWNVTYAQLGILTPPRMLAAASRDNHQLDPAALADAGVLCSDVFALMSQYSDFSW